MFLIDMQSKVPIFIQIQTQILKFIEAGVLKPGDRLPSVRQLARDNGINPNTVARAYSQLEESGYVYNVPKKGVYVAGRQQGQEAKSELIKTIEKFREDGVTLQQMLDAVEKVYGTR